jgi:hypothetical protein
MASKTSLLIDFDNIIKPHNLNKLISKIKPLPENKKYHIGLILVIPSTRLHLLEKIPLGYDRVNYINTQEFVNDILGHVYLLYNKKKKVCEIMGMKGLFTEHILNSLIIGIPNDVTLWIGIDIKNDAFNKLVKEYTKVGFQNPYICKTSPLGFKFSYYGLCMLKKNDITEINAGKDVEYVIEQFLQIEERNCTIRLQFNKKTLKYFKQLSRIGTTLNTNGSITQKELAGKLTTGIASEEQIFTLDVDRSSVISGEEEGVKSVKGLYSFHSHPQEAYTRHRVLLGWPSAQDYIGYLSSVKRFGTILHIIVSLEGLYILSMNNYWINKKDNDIYNFILKHYNIPYKKGNTPLWYLLQINSIFYKNYPIFLVQFLNWENSEDIINVSYHREGLNCFSNDKIKKEYKKLYNF